VKAAFAKHGIELEVTVFDTARSVQLYLLKTVGGERKRRYRFGTSRFSIEENLMVGVET
jgi:hypothetical protein